MICKLGKLNQHLRSRLIESSRLGSGKKWCFWMSHRNLLFLKLEISECSSEHTKNYLPWLSASQFAWATPVQSRELFSIPHSTTAAATSHFLEFSLRLHTPKRGEKSFHMVDCSRPQVSRETFNRKISTYSTLDTESKFQNVIRSSGWKLYRWHRMREKRKRPQK